MDKLMKSKVRKPRVTEGECVLVHLEEPDQAGNTLSPAEILIIFNSDDDTKTKRAEVRWLYYPSEIPKNRLRAGAYEEGELFETNHVDEIDVGAIVMNIRVLDEASYDEDPNTLEEVDGHRVVFFCRRHYDVDLKVLRAVSHHQSRLERGNLYSKRCRGPEFSPSSRGKRQRTGSPGTQACLPPDEMLRRLSHDWVPTHLPCRKHEKLMVCRFIQTGIEKRGVDAPLYISGMPGTGKTAITMESITRLRKTLDFQFVVVNGMRLSHPQQVYSLIWQELTGHAGVSPQRALKYLEARFSKADPKRKTCVLLLDELDYMVTKNQNVLYNLFNWPRLKTANLVVVGIANTMNLPERLKTRVSSRLGSHRVIFRPYTREQVEVIIQGRIGNLNAFKPGAVKMVGMKVAASAGDVRRALQICRKAIFLAIQRSQVSGEFSLTVKDVQAAANEVFEHPLNQAVQACSLFEKLFLIAMACEAHAKGKEQIEFAGVKRRFLGFLRRESGQEDTDMVVEVMEGLKVSGVINATQLKKFRDPILSITPSKGSNSLLELASSLRDDKLAEKYLPQEMMRIHSTKVITKKAGGQF